MSLLPLTEYESAPPEVKREYDDQIARHGRITNMKRTLLHNVGAFKAYMEWYTLADSIRPFTGDRALSLFAYAISSENDCLVCSTFFRKILIDSGDNPDDPVLSETEKLLMDFGRALSRDPHNIPPGLYEKLQARYNTEEQVLLFAFAGIMSATNLFNTIAQVPLDEVLYQYVKNEAPKGAEVSRFFQQGPEGAEVSRSNNHG
jgi:alkylhydroperoxidase family enzyme